MMIPHFAACVAVFEQAFLGSLGNHIQSGIIVALGSASFAIGTILRRSGSSKYELTKSQSYDHWDLKVPVDTPRGVMASPAEASPQSDRDAA